MFTKTGLRALLTVWVIWHLAFGLLATFVPDTGAKITGWSPQGGWNPDMLALSTQYGMVMILLAGVYAIMAVDPVGYLNLIWIAIGEQLLGISYAIYLYFIVDSVTAGQISVQSVINVVFAALFFGFWYRLSASEGRPRWQGAAA
ncbi:MAG TPA: hypothetical protein RMG48_12565 [Myxococcales bacterium LLY-WYZ-16_1]|nr:hypothetical protein [Myxococcales bacterium LLY-WYZ-16_1]